jgi:hypothetical protein
VTRETLKRACEISFPRPAIHVFLKKTATWLDDFDMCSVRRHATRTIAVRLSRLCLFWQFEAKVDRFHTLCRRTSLRTVFLGSRNQMKNYNNWEISVEKLDFRKKHTLFLTEICYPGEKAGKLCMRKKLLFSSHVSGNSWNGGSIPGLHRSMKSKRLIYRKRKNISINAVQLIALYSENHIWCKYTVWENWWGFSYFKTGGSYRLTYLCVLKGYMFNDSLLFYMSRAEIITDGDLELYFRFLLFCMCSSVADIHIVLP